MGIVTDLVYIITAALLGGLVAQGLKQPLIFGYILAGVIVGPYTGGITVENVTEIEMLAEIGVALLLFTLGLEFSFGEMRRLARITFLGTPIQVLLCAVMGYLIAHGLGLSQSDAIWIGTAMSLSSTMVVLKTLDARSMLSETSGRVMLAILIAQDLALVPLMLLLPQITGNEFNFSAVLEAVLKSAAFLSLMYLGGTRLIPRLFSVIARRGSRELFFLFTLTIAFGAGFLSHQLGLSFALGAFVAGMLLSETDFNHQALSDVSTLRDLFALIFFVSVGMLFDPSFFISHFSLIIALACALIASKALVTAGVMKLFGYGGATAWTVGLGISQIGEFAFVILKAGNSSGRLSSEAFSLMIAVTVVTMMATPLLFWLSSRISRRLDRDEPSTEDASAAADTLSDHVVIIGGGVVGQYVALVLTTLGRSYVVVESDHKVVTQMRDRGISVVFGDGSRGGILEAVGLERASLVVTTTTNDAILPGIIAEVKRRRADVPIVVRVEEVHEVAELSSLRVHQIVQPQLEVGIEMVRQSLLSLGVKDAEIFSVLGHLRSSAYDPIVATGSDGASRANGSKASSER
jgi:CPA2 family monovalent cation:H+ antiporter-2